jgi:NAD(P) transhydrogenase subunit alpha
LEEGIVAMNQTILADQAANLVSTAQKLATEANILAQTASDQALAAASAAAGAAGGNSVLIMGITTLVLACFVGYYVIWRVTPALHSPLMAVTNAISSVIIVGAIFAAGLESFSFSKVLGFLAVVLASVNIFGGFAVTSRMLQMFKKNR